MPKRTDIKKILISIFKEGKTIAASVGEQQLLLF